MIRIETEQILIRGNKRIYVSKIQLQKELELPEQYYNGKSIVGERYSERVSVRYQSKGQSGRIKLLEEKGVYSEVTFKENLAIIRALSKENEGWEGRKETFII